MSKDSTVSPRIKDIAIKLEEKLPCPVCFANEKGIPLSTLIEGAAEQWDALSLHQREAHDQENESL